MLCRLGGSSLASRRFLVWLIQPFRHECLFAKHRLQVRSLEDLHSLKGDEPVLTQGTYMIEQKDLEQASKLLHEAGLLLRPLMDSGDAKSINLYRKVLVVKKAFTSFF